MMVERVILITTRPGSGYIVLTRSLGPKSRFVFKPVLICVELSNPSSWGTREGIWPASRPLQRLGAIVKHFCKEMIRADWTVLVRALVHRNFES